MQDRLQVVSLTGVLRIKQFQKLEHEVLIDEALRDLGIHIIRDHKPQEELIYDLEVWPSPLEGRLVIFGVREGQRVLVSRLESAEDVGAHHADNILHQRLVEAVPRVVHVLHDLKKRLALRLLLALVGVAVEVEDHRAHLHLFAEELRPLARRRLPQLREGGHEDPLGRRLCAARGGLGAGGPRAGGLGLRDGHILAGASPGGDPSLLLLGSHATLDSLDQLHGEGARRVGEGQPHPAGIILEPLEPTRA
mmetsp:Transcript_39495/g.102224  ORF Transcript_39495/g.102224 Transcript_39495/m.102224 type:complete len:250 (+) Transcript_39495:955-1704(+)